MRTIIEIDRNTWADVKHFATVEKYTLNVAVRTLLNEALRNFGYRQHEERDVNNE